MKGKANREIADALFVTIHTVKSQLQTVFDKFDVRNRTELMFRINELLS
jgi:DNA-binding CsgD family transcriptional regulator